MSGDREGNDQGVEGPWIPHPHLSFWLQLDPRLVIPFFRTHCGDLVIPPGSASFAVVAVFLAACVRLWIAAESEGFSGPLWAFFDPIRPDHMIWPAYAVALAIATYPNSKENLRRRQNGEEVFSVHGNRSRMYLGWPRRLDPHEYYLAAPREQRRMWATEALLWESAVGYGVALLAWNVSGAFALWLAMNVFLSSLQTGLAVGEERRQRLEVESALFEAECRKALIAEIKPKRNEWR